MIFLCYNKENVVKFLMDADERLVSINLEIAKPGDKIRIIPVKNAVEPRMRVDKSRTHITNTHTFQN